MKVLLLFCFAVLVVQAKINPRIIGGGVARAGQFPYLAAIYTSKTDGGTYFCAGTIVNTEWIVTAASCIENATVSVIRLGSNSLSDSNIVQLSTDTHVLHPDYNPETFENDIGLIKFRLPIEFTDYVKAVDFLAISEALPQSSVVTAGWGQIDDDKPAPVDHMNFVYLVILSQEECKITFGDQITENMVCVDGNLNQGICNGDIGAPLIQYVNRGFSMIVGIASFLSGNGCLSTDPSGFTRFFPYKEWVINTTAPVS